MVRSARNAGGFLTRSGTPDVPVWKRALILVVDVLIVTAFIASGIALYADQQLSAGNLLGAFPAHGLLGLLGILYAVVFLAIYRATPGMRLFRTRLDARTPGILGYSLLYGGLFVIGSFFILIAELGSAWLTGKGLFETISAAELRSDA